MRAWQQGIIQSPAVQLPVSQLTVHASFQGAVTFRGHGGLHLSGSFGESYRPLLEWTQSISLPAGTQWTVWPELVADDGVKARLRFYERRNGFSGITGTWTEENLTQPAAVSAGEGLRLAISLEARGEGTLTVGALHIRQAVPDGDAFFPGTRREADAKGEEFFSLFGSMDRKPPLNVFFTDRRPQEGFDHLDYLYSLGAPFLVLTDPRLGGGCGYLGSPEYEEKITKRIRGALGTLGFNNSHLILAGNSLGAVGALYYGAVLHPRAMLLGKPLIHLGETALREKIWRPGGYPASLDLLQKLSGGTGRESAKQLDLRMCERLENGSFAGTEMAVAYMQEDDYDPSAYLDLLHHLRGKEARVYGKGFQGRHEDGGDEVLEWLSLRHRRLLLERFGRYES